MISARSSRIIWHPSRFAPLKRGLQPDPIVTEGWFAFSREKSVCTQSYNGSPRFHNRENPPHSLGSKVLPASPTLQNKTSIQPCWPLALSDSFIQRQEEQTHTDTSCASGPRLERKLTRIMGSTCTLHLKQSNVHHRGL